MKLFGLFHSGNPRAAWRATGGAACALWDAHAMRAHDTAGEGTLFAFSSGSCAQEALDAYETWGDDYPAHLKEPCATAILDTEQEKLILTRDPLGEVPVYYTAKEGQIAFSDWLPALLLAGAAEPVMDKTALNELFAIGPARSPGQTYIANIRELPPGYALVADANAHVLRQYFALEALPHEDGEAQTVDTVRDLLEQAMRRAAGCAGASMLSGGIDSSILTALLMRMRGAANSYSVEYEDAQAYFTGSRFQPELDSPYVEMAVHALKTNHRRVILSERQLVNALEDAAFARGMPGMGDVDSSLLLFARAIAAQENGVIMGECSDEVFGGYPWFRDEGASLTTFPWSGSLELRESILSSSVREALRPREYAQVRLEESLCSLPTLPGETGRARMLRAMQGLCFQYFMANLQERAYRLCDEAGLALYAPFCDVRLVQYVYNVPWEMKFLKGYEKGLLREAARDLLPRELLYRRKSPYPKTWNPEYMRLVRERFRSIASDAASPLRAFLDFDAVERATASASPAATPWFGQLMTAPQMLAYLIQIDRWMRAYGVRVEL
ncbi:MAG TPA: asparagine synthetase B [Candidatus Ornithocaccomicrobium faecavium]|uniref:asparagine synthase (glutamine-hydrolyzing) n=1 Tax=Candidatus Ornithocaccomicrobium faecavium TaxID=2840890 RepID=A0A9D1P5K8_9FIRM|nr:asparagine synthetase B [Candidatus Ornithocaccomicrobium faecavium]